MTHLNYPIPGAPPPAWRDTPFAITAAAHKAHCRITRFRLTQQEAWELALYLGRADTLLGYPIEIKRP